MRRITFILFIVTVLISFVGLNQKVGLCQYTQRLDIANSLAQSDSTPVVYGPQIKPIATTSYSEDDPAPNIPLLRWTIPPGSVYYEIEFLTEPPENPNGISPSINQYYTSKEVFTNGYSIDLSNYPGNDLYWRVRSIDYNNNPIGVFSDADHIYIDHSQSQILKPISNTGYKQVNMPMPLYPVYSWIPIYGAQSYEVELTTDIPENPNDTSPSKYRVRSLIVHGAFDCYDEQTLNIPGTYYWRVRGLDETGNAVGVYSDPEEFTVSFDFGTYAATIGDSITHGGGSISYSPADVNYSFQAYLDFPTINLGKSGDTTETMLNRFENDVLPYHPSYLIIMGGTNSLRGGVPADQVIEELAAFRNKCLLNDIRPIFLTLPPINPEAIMRAFNEETVPNWQEEFAAVNTFIREQKYYIDIESNFAFADINNNLDACYAVDGLHLDIEGKKIMAKIINDNWATVTE